MNSDREGLTQSEFNKKYAPWREITDDQIVDMSESDIDKLVIKISVEVTRMVRYHINNMRKGL